MQAKKTSHITLSGWTRAALLNILFLLLPIVSAQVVVSAFAQRSFGDEPVVEAIEETRQRIDHAFETLPPNNVDKRQFWSDLVHRELQARDFAAAKGFLLGSVQMLSEQDSEAIRATASELHTGGTDERLLHASAIYLSDDTYALYREYLEPQLNGGFDQESVNGAASAEAGPTFSNVPDRFSMLGDVEDLATNSQRWLNGLPTDLTDLRLSALGLMQNAPDFPGDETLQDTISLLRVAHRAGRLDPIMDAQIDRNLGRALPEAPLRVALAEALGELAPLRVKGERSVAAYRSVLDMDAFVALEREGRQVQRIIALTSPDTALNLVEIVKNNEDIRRVRLVAESGGVRAAALVKEMGPDFLTLADTGVNWTVQTVLRIMSIAAIFMAIMWLAFAAIFDRKDVFAPAKASEPQNQVTDETPTHGRIADYSES